MAMVEVENSTMHDESTWTQLAGQAKTDYKMAQKWNIIN